MTDKQKAKAYDEALERAKGLFNSPRTCFNIDQLTNIFPGLVESNEMIRKSLIEFLTVIKAISESGRTTWAVRKEDAEMCKSFIAWLEKQKENPKSTDSIPSDCTADAKCEDRWHKVVDSLPDNPREVLCKDEAGNYFIGRYYVGEGWEISNYDDEDKPHHLNPPVSKWIDFPSEKQKEQKPSALQDAFEHSVKDYSLEEKSKASNYADRILPTSVIYGESEEEYKLHKIMEAAFIAGQKEQNGEDGFLEDELSAFLQNYDKEYDDDAAVSDVARHFYEIGKKQNEQKPHTDEEKEYIRTIKSIISDFIRDKKPENLAYYQRIYDWLDGRHVPFSCGHENGKPADSVFSKQEYESHPIISEDTTSVKPAELDGKALLYTADKSYQIGFRDGVASVKPAEWSEEDENTIQEIIGCIEQARADSHLSEDHCLRLETFLYKHYRHSWKPSEEQMEALDKARRFIPYNCDALESLYNDLKKLT